MSGRTLSPTERELVREEVKKLLTEHKTQIALAKLLGVKQPHISAMVRKDSPSHPGFPLARAVADLRGIDVEDLLRGKSPRVEKDTAYPNRAVAARCARELGIPKEAIDRVVQDLFKGKPDMPKLDWFDEIRHEAMRIARQQGPDGGGPDDTPPPAGSPLSVGSRPPLKERIRRRKDGPPKN